MDRIAHKVMGYALTMIASTFIKYTGLCAFLSYTSIGFSQTLIQSSDSILFTFDNLNTNYGDAYDAVGGASVFPVNTNTASTTIYSGRSAPGLTVNVSDFSPGGVYSNAGSYVRDQSVSALRDGNTSDYALGLNLTGNFTLRLENSGPDYISFFEISYDLEQYSTGNKGALHTFTYSLDGANFITSNKSGLSDVEVDVAPGNGSNYSQVLTNARSGFVLEMIPPGESIYFRWDFQYDPGVGHPLHLGIDNVRINSIPYTMPVSEPGAIALIGFASVLVLRRRNRRTALS